MLLIYSIFIKLYIGIIHIASFFNKKAFLFINGRKNWREKLSKKITNEDEIIWIHCASLGEFEQGRPIIETFKKKYPQYKILLTFFSPSGYEVRKNYIYVDIISYIPIDILRNAKDFINIVNPKIAIFIKYEIWPIFFKRLLKKGIPVFITSAIFFEKFFYFKWYGKWILKYLDIPKKIFVQNKESQKLLNKYNINNVIVSGDTRFDRVLEIKDKDERLVEVEKFKEDKFLIVAGSTWAIDEGYLLEYINEYNGEAKFLIAPHNINKKDISRFKQKLNKQVLKYSSINDKTDFKKYQILILDTIGMLMKVYKYSNLTYIGGGFQKGIHNILEPATFGNPIIIGSKYNNFMEAVDLVNIKGAISVNSKKELFSTFDFLIKNKNILEKKGKICEDFVSKNKNAKKIILENITVYL